MALILNIDTATENASVCLSKDGISKAYIEHDKQKEHASFVHSAILDILHLFGIKLSDIDAFAVTSGPGSYTGLRVGLATAKGFCYTLSKPLILVNTLEVMASAALEMADNNYKPGMLFSPMIDARRMEVFTAIYDTNLNTIVPPQVLLLDENSFPEHYARGEIIFFGSGSVKFKKLIEGRSDAFADVQYNAKHLAKLACKRFQDQKFADVSYSEPAYHKEFYTVNAQK